jgi:hypothetical protein
MRHQQAIPKTRLMQWCWDVLHGSCCHADATSSPIEQAPQLFDVIAGTVEVIGHVSTTCAEPGVQTKRDDRESLQASSRLTTSWGGKLADACYGFRLASCGANRSHSFVQGGPLLCGCMCFELWKGHGYGEGEQVHLYLMSKCVGSLCTGYAQHGTITLHKVLQVTPAKITVDHKTRSLRIHSFKKFRVS